MLFRKSALACTSANHFTSLTQTSTIITACPPTSSSRIRPKSNKQNPQHLPRHTYSTAHDSTTSAELPRNDTPKQSSQPPPPPPPTPSQTLQWPTTTSPNHPPTPYAIFNLTPDEPYSKRTFYELVKLYHPDRASHALQNGDESILQHPPAELLNRYRLVIAANEILSDPKRREAYDRYGTGWVSEYASMDPSSPGVYKYGMKNRWQFKEDPMYNATWEDWERWYAEQVLMRRRAARRARREADGDATGRRWSDYFSTDERAPNKHRGIYANNHAFVTLVFLLAALGGAGQATRASESAKGGIERAQLVSSENSKILQQARQSSREWAASEASMTSAGPGESGRGNGRELRDKNIRRFLAKSGGYELDGEGEFDGRSLREGDDALCAPGLVESRGEKRFWEKPPENRDGP